MIPASWFLMENVNICKVNWDTVKICTGKWCNYSQHENGKICGFQHLRHITSLKDTQKKSKLHDRALQALRQYWTASRHDDNKNHRL